VALYALPGADGVLSNACFADLKAGSGTFTAEEQALLDAEFSSIVNMFERTDYWVLPKNCSHKGDELQSKAFCRLSIPKMFVAVSHRRAFLCYILSIFC